MIWNHDKFNPKNAWLSQQVFQHNLNENEICDYIHDKATIML